MRKLIITALAILLATALFSIQYEEVLNVPGATNFAWLDYDRDGDEDVLVSGGNVTNLYRNDGTAGFVNTGLPFSGFAEAEIHVADYNSDTYPDILISGYNNENYNPDYDPLPFYTTMVYTNNGVGGFAPSTIIFPHPGWNWVPLNVRNTQVDWFSSPDYSFYNGYYYLYISGYDESNSFVSCYYTMQPWQGNIWVYRGHLTSPLSNISYSQTFKNSNSLCLLTTGMDQNGEVATILTKYNEDNGNLISIDLGLSLPTLTSATIDLLDFDQDLDTDMFLKGIDNLGGYWNKMYRNDNNNFTDISYLFPGIDSNSAWCDFENDGDLDFLLSATQLFEQNPDHTFTPVDLVIYGTSATYLPRVWYDFNSDGFQDCMFIYDWLGNGNVLWRNNGNYTFYPQNASEIQLPNPTINRHKLQIPDFDFDGDNDMAFIHQFWGGFYTYRLLGDIDLIEHALDLQCTSHIFKWGDYDCDFDYDGLNISRLFTNNGNLEFSSLDTNYRFHYGWIDFNKDGYPDRWELSFQDVKIYINNGNGGFDIVLTINTLSSNIYDLQFGNSLDWADYDNDGDWDFIISAASGLNTYERYPVLYTNSGNNIFNTQVISAGRALNAKFIDYDTDGKQDIFLLGLDVNNYGIPVAYILHNNGNGNFSQIFTNLQPLLLANSSWGDFDSDGDPDLVMGGTFRDDASNQIQSVVKIYRNDGAGIFIDTMTLLPDMYPTDISWGDIDNDGDLDLLFIGGDSNSNFYSDVYLNTNAVFQNACAGLYNFAYGNISSCSFLDYNNNGTLDIVVSGLSRVSSDYRAILYENNAQSTNNPPTPPNLNYDNQTGFNFSGSSDDTTPAIALTYELRIGTTPGASDVVYPMADLNTGYRRVVEFGRHAWGPMDLPGDQTYYAAAQAIDNAYAGSSFGPEISFYVPPKPQFKLLSSATLDFGEQYIGYDSAPQTISITNTGTASLVISDLIHSLADSPFHIVETGLHYTVAVGDTLNLTVIFCPVNTSALADTLSLPYNGAYYHTQYITLSGTGIHVPPSVVENVQLNMQDDSAHLSWSPVQSTIFDVPLAVDRYVVIYSEDPYENEHSFYYLGSTPDTSFVHPRVAMFRNHMFYKVKAVKFYDREQAAQFDNLIAGRNDLRWQDVVGIVDDLRRKDIKMNSRK